MPITTMSELDAARTAARSEVDKRALKAGAKAAEPFGIATSIWGETVTDLIVDIQDIFQLTPEQRADLEPELLHGLSDLVSHYAPDAAKAGLLATMATTLRTSSLARRAAGSVATRAATRIGTRVARSGRFGASALGAVARRAWVIPLALGGGTAAMYEVLGRRCINQCHAYLLARIAPGATAAPGQPVGA